MDGHLVILHTADNVEYRGLLQCQYYLEYTGEELHRVAAANLGIPVRADDGVLHLSRDKARRWLDPGSELGAQGVAHGDTVLVLSRRAHRPPPRSFAGAGSGWGGAEVGPPRAGRARLSVAVARLAVPRTVVSRVVVEERPLAALVVRLADFRGRAFVAPSVFQAADARGAAVAVKLLPKEFDDAEQRRAFLADVRRIAPIRHPTLLALRGFVPADNADGEQPALVTDFMPRGSLQSALDGELAGAPAPWWDETQRFIALYGTAVGMMVLHRHGITHRYLKARNVLFDACGDPHVCDFSIPKHVSFEQTAGNSLTADAMMYTAPEVLDSDESAYTQESDVYAFGILLYAAVARRPFLPHGVKAIALVSELVTSGYRPEIPAAMNEHFKALVRECWDSDPQSRPAFEQIVMAFEAIECWGDAIDVDRVLDYRRKIFVGKLRLLEVRLADFPREAMIGDGSFGNLYSARDPRTGELVAVKVMKRDLLREQDRRMFQREVEILASVDHPTLLAFRGYVPVDNPQGDPPAILTEFMPRHSLEEMLRLERAGRAPADWNDTTRFIVVYGVAVAMMFLHENRVLHRDLKPDNVLLTNDLEPRVGDFGLSKFVDPGATMLQTMQAGTIPFMAPEIYEGASYSFPVDVYAYGVLLYVTITGQEFFSGVQNAYSFGLRVQRGERPPIPVHVARYWRELIERCWAGDPLVRPSFVDIVHWYGTATFINPSIDVARFREYQRTIVSEDFWCRDEDVTGAVVAPVVSQLARLKIEADNGDPYSANLYGCRLRDGEDIEADISVAATYFQRAAQGGDPHGMINWGKCLEFGQGVPEDVVEGAHWYYEAMNKGETHGMLCYAEMLEQGKGVDRDPTAAAQLYKQAADAGDDVAQTKYGMICEHGLYGVSANNTEAARYYRMASDQGSAHGMVCFAEMLEAGKGVPAETQEAIRLYRLAAQKNNPKALGALGMKMVHGTSVPKDVASGKELISKQIALGDPTGLFYLARIAEEGLDGSVNLPEAFRNYAMAAGQGVKPALLKMLQMMMLGIGTPPSVTGALDMYRSLIDKDCNTDAMVQLGLHYLLGEGVSKDPPRGRDLILRAAALGNSRAIELRHTQELQPSAFTRFLEWFRK
jgi:serine/threonine protein kinase/TPR repeat protein